MTSAAADMLAAASLDEPPPARPPKIMAKNNIPQVGSAPNLVLTPEEEEIASFCDVALDPDTAPADRVAAAGKVAHGVKAQGVMALRNAGVIVAITEGFAAKAPATRVGAFTLMTALTEICKKMAEPYLIPLLKHCLDGAADKGADVNRAAVAAARALVNNMCPYGARYMIPDMVTAMAPLSRWQQKYAACVLLNDMMRAAPSQSSRFLPSYVPALRNLMVDARDEVKEVALGAMQTCLSLVGNRDIEPMLQDIIGCILEPAKAADTIHKLGATTFAQPVDDKTLAIMVPLLIKGLRERNTPVKRKTALIITNMVKLVENPAHVAPFMGQLLPEVDKVSQEISDPEARAVAMNTHAMLVKAAGSEDGAAAMAEQEKHRATPESVAAHMKQELSGLFQEGLSNTLYSTALDYVACMCTCLMDDHNFDKDVWDMCFSPYIGPFVGEYSKEASVAVLKRCHYDVRLLDGEDDDDEEGEDLCDCEFSLAYGGRILLSQTKMRLKKRHRYGLCGPNGAGKTTLMKAIANGQVDGFPDRDEVLTIYVAHDIQSTTEDPQVVNYLSEDPLIKAKGLSHAMCKKALEDIGFDDDRLYLNISALSGGWKMKLALARAVLLEAGLLLLDEPTNHMDHTNVAWLQNYLLTCGVTLITVSHDSGFLDTVCTDIIHYENKKLVKYKGNLSAFVAAVPEAKSYYELTDEFQKFTFPKPGFLDGVKSREKPVLKCKKLTFQYEGASKPQLLNVTLKASMSARIAVLGPNGAGKSTLIKLLTGELKPTSGEVEKHPNLRIAYIAQHAFHHLEEFQHGTPVQYIRARYEQGEDAEEAEKVFRKLTDEDKQKMQTFVIDGMERTLGEIKSRRKKKGIFEYEVSWKNLTSIKYNVWFKRDELVARGFGKLIAEYDGKVASAAGDKKALTANNIEEYLGLFGLDSELARHSHIKGLSGGQKVKLVLAAAMWHNPHFLIMDEPTNYLDRDSLGALAGAIRDFEGGVLLISHNNEFTSALCPEIWAFDAGVVTVKHQELRLSGGEH